MNAIKYILLSCLLTAAAQLNAQNTIFLTEGKIEFEKKLNLYSQLDENSTWSELEKKMMPKFKTTYFDLVFT